MVFALSVLLLCLFLWFGGTVGTTAWSVRSYCYQNANQF